MPDKTFGQVLSDQVFHVDEDFLILCFASKDLCTVGDGVAHFPVPPSINGFNLTGVHAQVATVGGSGTMDIQVHNVTDTVDMLTSKLTVDAGEKGSNTAATPAVIDATNDDVVENDELRIDVDVIHTGPAAKGLVVRLTFSKP